MVCFSRDLRTSIITHKMANLMKGGEDIQPGQVTQYCGGQEGKLQGYIKDDKLLVGPGGSVGTQGGRRKSPDSEDGGNDLEV